MREVSAEEAFGMFKPEICVFVISADKDRRANGMVASWNMRCSDEPPMLAVALSKDCNTRKLIEECREFVIAVANKELEKEMMFFGTRSGRDIDKFKESGIETEKAKFVKLPLIKKATINFECRLEKEIETGECIIFIGEIIVAHINYCEKVLVSLKKIDEKRVLKEL